MKQTRETLTLDKGSARTYTDEGFLIVPARIARTGVQDYRAIDLGVTDGDPMRMVKVYRSADEVFNADSMASFENKPITDDHPQEAVTADNWKTLAVGFARNIRRDGDFMVADLVITDKKAIDAVASGKVQLSNGYLCDYEFKAGKTADGIEYDAVQKNIRGNHVALVDAARCGPVCRVSDSTNHKKGKKMADRKVTIDGIPFEASEGLAAAVDKLIADRDALKATKDSVKLTPFKVGEVTIQVTDAAPLVQLVADHAAQVETLKKDVMTPDQRDAMVEAWVKLTADAKRLVKDYDTKGKTCDAIRREVIAALATDAARKPVLDAALAGREVKALDAEAVKMIFNILAATATTDASTTDATQTTDALATALKSGTETKDGGDKKSQPVGRAALLARLNPNA